MVDIGEFYSDFRNAVALRASVENDFTAGAFVSEISDHLAEAEEIDNLTSLHFSGIGHRQKRLAISGFDFDDADNSIALAVLVFKDSDALSSLTMTEAKRHIQSLENYLTECVGGTFGDGREESSPAYQLAQDIKMRGRNVSRFRLYLLTDARMSDSMKAIPSSDISGVRIDYHIWDMARLFQVNQSRQGREELQIDLTEWLPHGLPILEVEGHSDNFSTYLAAVPGKIVADLFARYGSRLLESNVRSFLGTRLKINKGIRTTVLSEPEMFMAYNNGITATATGVSERNGKGFLTDVKDLQIVNGGQTTASLFYVSREAKERSDLTDVFVQMKLIVVDPEQSVEMVPNIARFANSQNRVSEADFSSNRPFHVRMETLSRRILAPAKAGLNFQTKWYYERARAQYHNDKARLSVGEARRFEATYPKTQLIKKIDAAKYEASWAMKPHVVSAGAQKNFVAFANEVSSKWDVSDAQFNETYFKNLVAKAILFNHVRAKVSRAPWYGSGYLANVVTYTLAKLAFEVDRQGEGGRFNFEEIWATQSIRPLLSDACLLIAEQVYGSLTGPGRRIMNVTEWAKSEECWRQVKGLQTPLSDEYLETLVDEVQALEQLKDAASTQKIDNGIAAQRFVLSQSPEDWELLRAFALDKKIAGPTDAGILDLVSGRKSGFASERQSIRLLDFLKRAKNNGFAGF
jgi:hypothetical protein